MEAGKERIIFDCKRFQTCHSETRWTSLEPDEDLKMSGEIPQILSSNRFGPSCFYPVLFLFLCFLFFSKLLYPRWFLANPFSGLSRCLCLDKNDIIRIFDELLSFIQCHLSSSFCLDPLGNTESQAVPALPAEGRPVRSCGRIRLQRLPPQAVHAQRNLPHHIPPCRWVEALLGHLIPRPTTDSPLSLLLLFTVVAAVEKFEIDFVCFV